MNKINHRKIWIINKRFQYKFILVSLMPMIITIIFFWICIELTFFKMIRFANESGLNQDHALYSLLKGQKNELISVLLICSIFSSVLYIMWAISYSNKIAGPLYRLKMYFKNLRKVESNSYPKLSFREKDYFLEVADEINEFFKRAGNDK